VRKRAGTPAGAFTWREAGRRGIGDFSPSPKLRADLARFETEAGLRESCGHAIAERRSAGRDRRLFEPRGVRART